MNPVPLITLLVLALAAGLAGLAMQRTRPSMSATLVACCMSLLAVIGIAAALG